MILSHIVAVSKNFVIGRNNRLPWKMPSDAQYFHDISMGHVVIMGRKNYQANKRALPGRTNIVITHQKYFSPGDALVVYSIDEAIIKAEEMNEDECFIVGGGHIYEQTLNIVDRIYITVIDTVVKGDAYYPEIDFDQYAIISRIPNKADEKNPFDYTYYILEQKSK